MAIESLAQQTSAFVDALTIKPAATETTEDEVGRQARTPDQGDTVTISEEARAIIAMEKPGESKESEEKSDKEQTIKMLKNRIKKLEEEIKKLEENDDLPKTRKMSQLQDKETQLMELREQLIKAEQAQLKADGKADGGGTRAEGFGDSVSTF